EIFFGSWILEKPDTPVQRLLWAELHTYKQSFHSGILSFATVPGCELNNEHHDALAYLVSAIILAGPMDVIELVALDQGAEKLFTLPWAQKRSLYSPALDSELQSPTLL